MNAVTSKTRAKNPANKERRLYKGDKPYATWTDPRSGWVYKLVKSWQADNSKPYARWFCLVDGDFEEYGDCYAADLWPGLLMARRLNNGSVWFDDTVWETEGQFMGYMAGEK